MDTRNGEEISINSCLQVFRKMKKYIKCFKIIFLGTPKKMKIEEIKDEEKEAIKEGI